MDAPTAAASAETAPLPPELIPDEDDGSADAFDAGDDVDSDDASSDANDGGSDWPAEERLARAESCKASGNDLFKSADLAGAAKLYAQAVKVLKPLRDLDDAVLDAGVRARERALTVSLHLNAAAVDLRRERWRDAAAAASRALDALPRDADADANADADPDAAAHAANRGKALLRRGIARARSGDLEDAQSDLATLLRADRGNREAAREFAQVRQRLDAQRAQAKQQFSAAFAKASQSGGVYGDKEAARKRDALRKIETERARREDWQRDKDINGRELSFEDWCVEDDARKAQDRKLQEQRDREAREKQEAARAAARAEEQQRKQEAAARAKAGGDDDDVSADTADDDDDDDDLDEEDRRILAETRKQGYCYFRRELSEHEKQLLQASGAAPAKLDAADAPQVVGSGADRDGAAAESSASAPVSEWNAAGTTWEQRDVSAAARADLEAALLRVTAEAALGGARIRARVTRVESVDGDAHIAVTRAKPAPLYDLTAKVKWALELLDDENDAHAAADGAGKQKAASGTLHLPDISNGVERHAFEVETRVTRRPADGSRAADVLDAALDLLREQVCAAVGDFVDALHLK